MSEKDDTLLNFPCDFRVKVMGENSQAFESFVVMTLRKHFPDLGESAVQEKLSKGQKYLSMTVTVNAKSKAQLDDAYRELSANPRVLFVL